MIGENIKKLRKAKGMTQEELAQVLCVSYQAVSKWENGGSPDLDMLPVLANTIAMTENSRIRGGGSFVDIRLRTERE